MLTVINNLPSDNIENSLQRISQLFTRRPCLDFRIVIGKTSTDAMQGMTAAHFQALEGTIFDSPQVNMEIASAQGMSGLSGLSADHISNIPLDALAGFSVEHVNNLSTDALAGFSPQQISALQDPMSMQLVVNEQPSVVNEFTAQDIAAFPPTITSAFLKRTGKFYLDAMPNFLRRILRH